MDKIKKFIIPIIGNIIILLALPLVFNALDEETSKSAWLGMLSIGNSIYFFIQGQEFSKKYKDAVILVLLNFLSQTLYMHGFFGKVEVIYLAFYTAMTLLGLRAGGNHRKLMEYKNNQKD